jgi:hypothetical protein
MQLEPLFPLSYILPSGNYNFDKYSDVKPWVRTAIAEEDHKPNNQLWKKEPSAEYQLNERLCRIRFLRKYGKCNPVLNAIADRLELCEQNNRCCSGACPECGRLIQRWFVRKSKRLIRDHIEKADHELVAITIIPATPIIGPGNLHTLSLLNMQRRLKYALEKASLDIVIGGIDFSFNEDRDGKYEPFWSPHFYLITSVNDERKLKRQLKKNFKAAPGIPRPVKKTGFDNSATRRSYAFKMVFERRIGITNENRWDGRKCRNTSRDKLRAAERLELFAYLDRVGFEQRLIFRKVEPSIRGSQVRIKPIPAGRHRIRRKSKNRL